MSYGQKEVSVDEKKADVVGWDVNSLNGSAPKVARTEHINRKGLDHEWVTFSLP